MEPICSQPAPIKRKTHSKHTFASEFENRFRVFSLKTEDWEKASSIIDVSCMEIKEGEMIYEYVWYPYANSIDPQTFCFLSTCRVCSFRNRDLKKCSRDIRCIYGMPKRVLFERPIVVLMPKTKSLFVRRSDFRAMVLKSMAASKTASSFSISIVLDVNRNSLKPLRKPKEDCVALSLLLPSPKSITKSWQLDRTPEASEFFQPRRTNYFCIS